MVRDGHEGTGVIVLIVTPDEATQIRDGLPAGALRDRVAGMVAPHVIPAPIPELIVCWPRQQFSEEIFDPQVAQRVYRAVVNVLDRRGYTRRPRS